VREEEKASQFKGRRSEIACSEDQVSFQGLRSA
jgi:hypothetical protein